MNHILGVKYWNIATVEKEHYMILALGVSNMILF